MQPLELIRTLIAIPGPCGQEQLVRDYVLAQLRSLKFDPILDAKGNVIVRLGNPGSGPKIVVTAHLDELSLMISSIESDGRLRVTPLGGTIAWKWGEGPVEIMAAGGFVPGILSFGSMHSNHKESIAEQASRGLNWNHTFVFTGLSPVQLDALGVRVGLRVILARSRRVVTECGECIGSYFIDDRAPLAVWLMALKSLSESRNLPAAELVFAATVSEEVGAHGATFLMNSAQADICVALEIGPKTPDACVAVTAQPTIWVKDSHAAMEHIDGEILAACCKKLDQAPQWQNITGGGSDASIAAKYGQAARPVTLAVAVENSHGYEIMHCGAPIQLHRLLLEYLRTVVA
jgi:putative aminopeptidase FrvX